MWTTPERRKVWKLAESASGARWECRAVVVLAAVLLGSALTSRSEAQLWYPLNQLVPDDLRVSSMGPDQDTAYFASLADVAYNSVDDEYLVVWNGDDGGFGELEIYGRRIGRDGNPIGAQFRISHQGPDGNASYWAMNPAVAHNSVDDEYLVVWAGSHDVGEYEIIGQRLAGATGAPVGPPFRISFMGPDGNINYSANLPAVAYNAVNNLYLVVWDGDDNVPPHVLGKREVRGRKVASDGSLLDVQLMVSALGGESDPEYDAGNPDVAWDPVNNQFLVVFSGDDDSLANDESEIWGQYLAGPAGVFSVLANFRISFMGPDANPQFGAWSPAVAFNPDDQLYLVVWYGDTVTGTLVDDEFEVFGREVGALGNLLDTQLWFSHTGPDGDTSRTAWLPDVAFDPHTRFFLVVWASDHSANDEEEVWAQLSYGVPGVSTIIDNTRLSTMGPNGSTSFAGIRPAVACSPRSGHWLVAWEGDDDRPPLVEGEFEIFSQLVAYGLFRDGFESGSTWSWSAVVP